ncbi:tocopherol O-methyltransferase- chloroplastic [Apiospora marii]|uniref:Tocopherol O-methyltransferase- chloroplastic n=1 Tax=Apiospora marii TaxID=335849 RepID=A0ABR1SRN0_9PEZI
MPPPNTPEEGLVSAPTTTATLALRPITRDLEMTAASPPTAAIPAVDLRALEYESNVDENLICPICRVALVAPVITNCDHVFCQKCLVQAHTLNPVCPVDRQPLLKLSSETRSAPKLVTNQLDNLTVRCPNRMRGCDLVVARSLVENHVSRYCDKTLVPCPHPSCDKTIARKDMAKGCLHYEVSCEFCEQAVQKADLETHQDMECLNRKKDCELCGAEFVRSKQEEHTKECPEVEGGRPGGRAIGRAARRDDDAEGEGPAERPAHQVPREPGLLRPAAAAENLSNMPLPAAATPQETAPYESRDQYFLSLFETMESKVERLSSALTEVEGRHSMMLFNETMPIKDQLTEIRSTLGVLGMHVRWLMNFRLQERGRVLGSGGGAGGANSPSLTGAAGQETGGGGGSDSNLPRRLSENMREHPPRL